MENNLSKEFWTKRYEDGTTGWDIGYPSTPLKEYIDRISDKKLKILVPGAGNAYEVEYLWNAGFKNVFVLDISPIPLENFKNRNPTFPQNQLLLKDFFQLEDHFDLVLEQTFFCAIDRKLRLAYAKKMHEIILPGGKLAGVLFGFEFEKDGPPFGGSKEEYLSYFKPYFTIEKMDTCMNSIPPRAGNELWIELVRK
jgi:thiopurine S-methyltransferase